jgi:hypothetical protein
MTADELGELPRMLQAHTPVCKLTDMEVRAALELMQQRGWKITRAKDRRRTSRSFDAAGQIISTNSTTLILRAK